MVTGAVAAIIYGEPRLTNDIDIVLALSGREARRLPELFDPAAFYLPPAEAIEAERLRPWHGHFNLIHIDTALKADIYLLGEDPLHHWALARRRKVQVNGEAVYVAPPEYVILRKLEYFRSGRSDKHVRDIVAIMRTFGAELDLQVLRAEVERLALAAEWQVVDRALAEAPPT